jgi:hypothetical protein
MSAADDRDALAKAIDPDAFEHHDSEARRHSAALQWAVRRHIAKEHADRLIASAWLAARDRRVAAKALREAAKVVREDCMASTAPCFCGSATRLDERADRIEQGAQG